MESKEDKKLIIPDLIIDHGSNSSYKKGRFFGKGGFAQCYEITDMKTNAVFAGKIVSKTLMTSQSQKSKMAQEISIHRSLGHKHVVGFHGFFEDTNNVYIILELCRRRSMMELHKRRKAITEPEARYYLHQILLGVLYLHQHNIIHRDLKLGNVFLSDNLEVKIGDFGLAAKLEYNGERKKTLCGTPNYIAPEILTKKGHSFEVDVWSIGCILYTLLVGKPPFETKSLKETYAKIKTCDYNLPPTSRVSRSATRLIKLMLQTDPALRPTVQQCLDHEFFTTGYMPAQLPVSVLTMAPRFDALEKVMASKVKPTEKMDKAGPVRKPLVQMNGESGIPSPKLASGRPRQQSTAIASNRIHGEVPASGCRKHLVSLRDQLSDLLASKPGPKKGATYGDDMTDPAAQPIVWISKWVDYSDKYGFGYQLSDEGVGVMFNDTTKLVLLADGTNVHYINSGEHYYTLQEYPKELEKKMKLLNYFRRYMMENLMNTGDGQAESNAMSRMPYLFQWFRTTSAVIMQLTNGTLQINFIDHSKVIMCPLMGAVTFIDIEQKMRTFRFSSIVENGCCDKLAVSLKYALDKIDVMIGF